MNPRVRRFLRSCLIALVAMGALFGVIQLVPYGRAHSNPRVVAEPMWDSPRTRELAVRACFDCHSNETKWPTYSEVAPLSWVVQRDVDAGREVFNFSEWHRPQDLAHYSGLSVRSHGMPPAKYRFAHPEADLSDDENHELARGLDATLKQPGQR
jgi:hypothetical protein